MKLLKPLIIFAGILIPLAFLLSVGKFLGACWTYHERAILGTAQLSQPRLENEAIVVLTGDHGRIPRALELLQERGSELLVISGTAKGASLTDLVNQQAGAIFHIKDTWEKIVLDSESSSTIENAERSAPILLNHGIRHVILVTSDYHMGRALSIFHQVLPDMKVMDYSVATVATPMEMASKLWAEYWKTILYRGFTSFEVQAYSDQKPALR